MFYGGEDLNPFPPILIKHSTDKESKVKYMSKSEKIYRKSLGEVAILKRVTGLSKLHGEFTSSPSKFAISRQGFSMKDRDHKGKFLESFKDDVLPGVNTILAPFWNDLKSTYWTEDRAVLDGLIKDLKVRFPKNHQESPGQLIKSEDVDPEDYMDEFFNSPDLKRKRMTGGTYAFNLQDDALDVLLYYCYKSDPRCVVKHGDRVSKALMKAAKYELVIPKDETTNKVSSIKKKLDVSKKLSSLDFEKQKMIAYVMKLRLSNIANPDPDELLVVLSDASQDTKIIKKWNMSNQDKFLQLASMGNNDLGLSLDITKGKDYRIITTQRGDYYLNNEKLDGVMNEATMFNYLKQDDNSEKYTDLVDLISEKERNK